MWFYFALYLLSGLIFFLHPYVSIFMLIILVISCYIKWQSFKNFGDELYIFYYRLLNLSE